MSFASHKGDFSGNDSVLSPESEELSVEQSDDDYLFEIFVGN